MMTEWRMFLFGAPPELVIKFRLAIHAGCEMNLMMEQHESEKPFHFPHRSAYEKIRAPLACLDVSFLDGLFLTPLGRVSKLRNSWRPKMSRAADFCFSNRAENNSHFSVKWGKTITVSYLHSFDKWRWNSDETAKKPWKWRRSENGHHLGLEKTY